MNRYLILLKWLGMIAWFGVPLVMRQQRIWFMSDTAIVVWLLFAVVFAVLQYAIASLRLMQHLETKYPEKYKEAMHHKKNSLRSRDISARCDIMFQFAPSEDGKFSVLKKNCKESIVFMLFSAAYGFALSWISATIKI